MATTISTGTSDASITFAELTQQYTQFIIGAAGYTTAATGYGTNPFLSSGGAQDMYSAFEKVKAERARKLGKVSIHVQCMACHKAGRPPRAKLAHLGAREYHIECQLASIQFTLPAFHGDLDCTVLFDCDNSKLASLLSEEDSLPNKKYTRRDFVIPTGAKLLRSTANGEIYYTIMLKNLFRIMLVQRHNLIGVFAVAPQGQVFNPLLGDHCSPKHIHSSFWSDKFVAHYEDAANEASALAFKLATL